MNSLTRILDHFVSHRPWLTTRVGLITVISTDPLSQLTRRLGINNQPFDGLGFYYYSTLDRNYRVTIFYPHFAKPLTWLPIFQTIDDLQMNPYFSMVKLYPLTNHEDQFRNRVNQLVISSAEIDEFSGYQSLLNQQAVTSSIEISHTLLNSLQSSDNQLFDHPLLGTPIMLPLHPRSILYPSLLNQLYQPISELLSAVAQTSLTIQAWVLPSASIINLIPQPKLIIDPLTVQSDQKLLDRLIELDSSSYRIPLTDDCRAEQRIIGQELARRTKLNKK